MTALFTWLANLPPLAQIPLIILAFGAVIGLVLFFVEIAPRSGRGYGVIRLAVAVLVPVALMLIFGIYTSASWVLGLGAVLGGGLFLLDYRSRQGKGYILQLLAFMSPAIGLLLVGLVYPTVKTVIAAFFSNDGSHFVGLQNFFWVFSGGSEGFTAVVNTIVWVLIGPFVATAIGLAYAVFIDKSRGEKVLKVLVFMPVAISFVGASIIWKFFYDYQQGNQIGLLNQIVVWLGGQPVSWLQVHPLNVLLLIVILIWSQTGFAMVVLSAAIRGVPVEQLEAAELDGTNGWQSFWNVTVPGIRPTLVVVLITISIMSLKVYDIVAATTGGQNGTTVLGYQMVNEFELLPPQTGYSAALALLLFVLVTPFLIFNARQIRKQREIG
jgi:alpha-glucoside transport system permease protein